MADCPYEIVRSNLHNVRKQASGYLCDLNDRVTNLELSPGGGVYLDYEYTTSVAGDPGVGRVGADSLVLASITELHFSKTTLPGNDATVILSNIVPDDIIALFEAVAPNGTSYFDVTGVPVDSGAYFTIPVTNTILVGQALPALDGNPVTFNIVEDSGGDVVYTYVDANYSMIRYREVVLVDSSVGAITITLPPNPTDDQYAGVWDAGDMASTNNITIARNGESIIDRAENAVIDQRGGRFDFVWEAP